MMAPRVRAAWTIFAVVLVGIAAPATAHICQPGEKVEYKVTNTPETWEQGTCLRAYPGGVQVLVLQAPSQFFPEGSQMAYAIEDVRPLTKAAAAPQPVAPPVRAAAPPAAPPTAAVRQPAPVPGTTARLPAAGPAIAPGGGGQMSAAEVLGFLKQRLGDGDPFRNPQRPAALAALREEVMRRGVSFRYYSVGDFANQLGKYGALNDVTAPLADNFGPPAKQAELMGTWRIAKVGAPTTVTRGGNLYQRQEYAGLAGSLTVNANGTYVWNSPSGLLRGNWRPATREEMSLSHKGGEGVVLLKAKSGADWLIHKRTEEGPVGTGIMIRDLATRNMRERATR